MCRDSDIEALALFAQKTARVKIRPANSVTQRHSTGRCRKPLNACDYLTQSRSKTTPFDSGQSNRVTTSTTILTMNEIWACIFRRPRPAKGLPGSRPGADAGQSQVYQVPCSKPLMEGLTSSVLNPERRKRGNGGGPGVRGREQWVATKRKYIAIYIWMDGRTCIQRGDPRWAKAGQGRAMM